MSKYALLVKEDGTCEPVFAKNCGESDRNNSYVCPQCGCPMFLRMGDIAEKHFFAEHAKGCDVAEGKAKFTITPTGYVIPLQSILNHTDKPLTDESISSTGIGETRKLSPENGDDDFSIFIPGVKSLSSVSSIFRYVSSLTLDDVIDVDSGLTVKDFLVDNRTIYNCRQNGFNNEIRLVTTTRFRPSTLRNAPHKEGYILLRDAFSRNNDDAIYFLIRIKEPSQYAKFCSLLFGTKAHPEKRSPKKHIRLLAKWHRIANQRYHVYCADINAKCYAFDD